MNDHTSIAVTIGVGARYRKMAQYAGKCVERHTGLRVVILDENHLQSVSCRIPQLLKLHLFDLVDADALLYFDADWLLLHDLDVAPWLNSSAITAVRDIHWANWIANDCIESRVPIFDYFNSGMFIANRAHHASVFRLARNLERHRTGKLFDQTLLNMACSLLETPVRYLPKALNWVGFSPDATPTNLFPISAPHFAFAESSEGQLNELTIDPLSRSAYLSDIDHVAAEELANQVLWYHRVGYDCRQMLLLDDFTIGSGGARCERYWFPVRIDGELKLAICSETGITCMLGREADRMWRGEWQIGEGMPVTLTKEFPSVAPKDFAVRILEVLQSRLELDDRLSGVIVDVGSEPIVGLLLIAFEKLNLDIVLSPPEGDSRDTTREQLIAVGRGAGQNNKRIRVYSDNENAKRDFVLDSRVDFVILPEGTPQGKSRQHLTSYSHLFAPDTLVLFGNASHVECVSASELGVASPPWSAENVAVAEEESSPALQGNDFHKPGFKLFGLQRTCTNLIRRALLNNFHIDSLEEGWEWKHGRIGKIAHHRHNSQPVMLVICVRNPYAWLLSCYRYFLSHQNDNSNCPHFNYEGSFQQFLESPHYGFSKPADRWSMIYCHYLQWLDEHPHQGILLRAEDLMGPGEQEVQLGRVKEHFGLSQRDDSIHVFKRRVSKFCTLTQNSMNFEYYTNEEYLREYTQPMLDCVNGSLDATAMSRCSYSFANECLGQLGSELAS